MIDSPATPRSSFGKTNPETGWLSRATFESLPNRFRRIAEDLQRKGEIVIE